MRYVFLFLLMAALLAGCATEQKSDVNASISQPTASQNTAPSVSSSLACPRQMVDCASPGICAAFTDGNADQLCDASQKP